MTTRQLVIDSRQRVSGSETEFVLNFNQALEPCRVASLVFASLPSAELFVDPYWYLSLSGFGADCRDSSTSHTSFVIPVLGPAGYRTIYNESANFVQQTRGPSNALSQMTVKLYTLDGVRSPLTGEDWFVVLRLTD